MGILVGFAVLILSNQAQAQPDMFVGYDSFCGLPVVVGHDPQTATARKNSLGKPFIHIDPGAISNWTTSRIFVLAHECAHHLLGHTNTLGEMERYFGGTRKQELEADCWAARQLRRFGHMFDLDRTVLEQLSRGHFKPGGGYPSGTERATNIVQCSRSGSRLCRHRAHRGGDRVQCEHVRTWHRGDLYPCSHPCPSPVGAVPCHPRGDIGPCLHSSPAHRFDRVPCTHPSHPAGH